MRCPVCTNSITLGTVRPSKEDRAGSVVPRVRTWESFADLEARANGGCDLCTLFRQYLTNFVTHKDLSESKGEVKLFIFGGDSLGLNCDTFDGTIIVPVLDRGDTSDWRGARSTTYQEKGTFEQAAEWLQECVSRHTDCYGTGRSVLLEAESSIADQFSPNGRLPKRLLDLTHGESVFVIDCAEWVESGLAASEDLQEYCTLSYRWGDTSHSCVLTGTFDLMLELSLSDMPQTFKDAVAVTRRLGIRFLWIDALCIVQPSPEDNTEWLEEGSRMGIIYENAVCTIAATSAAHAGEGFLNSMGIHVYSADPCILTNEQDSSKTVILPTSTLSFAKCVTESALNCRGWVVQERALSKRVLHFTERGLFWECGTIKANAKNAPEGLSAPQDFPSCRSKETLLSIARVRITSHVCPVEWFHFVRQYSFAEFTNPGDRLLALSSVARAVQPFFGRTEYVAGLWKHDLIRGLAWYCRWPKFYNRKEFDAIAPTWSWASVIGGITFAVNDLRTWRYDLVDTVDVNIKPSVRRTKFGSVLEGRLKIKGTLEGRDLISKPENSHGYWSDFVIWDEPLDEEAVKYLKKTKSAEGASDTATQPISALDNGANRPRKNWTCLPIASGNDIMSSRVYAGALVLEPIGEVIQNDKGISVSVSNEYRRIGWAEYLWEPVLTIDQIRENLRNWRDHSNKSSFIRAQETRQSMNPDPKEITIL